MIKIVIAGIEGCLGSSFVGLTDMLALARRAIADSTGVDAPFYVVTASEDGARVIDGAGRRFDVETSFAEIAACDAIIVPGFTPDSDGQPPSMSRHAAAAAWIRRHHSRGAIVGAAGTGAFLLGEAGLLDGRRCTTNWWRQEELKRRWPRADPAWGATLIEDRRIVTTSGPMSWIDLALYVIRVCCGDEAARIAADFTVDVLDPAARQAHVPNIHAANANPFLSEAERIVRQAGGTQLSAQDLAHALSTSERTLHRKLKQACGESPKTFIDRVRVETARTLLESSAKSLKELAASAGFSDEASFRRTFRRYCGMAPGAYRAWARVKNQRKSHMFAVQKDSELIPEILTRILDSCVNGVTLADPDQEDTPIIYANLEFEKMTGYVQDEIIGRNCRFLQGEDRNQEGLHRLREAVKNHEHIEVTLRNYRKDGELFHNRLNITPLFDAAGRLIYFLGVQYDVTEHVYAEQEILELKARLQSLEGSRRDKEAEPNRSRAFALSDKRSNEL
jgi:PAS domain S-box-containing protein